MPLADGGFRWWYELQLSLSLFCEKHMTTPLMLAINQCVARGMDYEFMRRMLPMCVDDSPLTIIHFRDKGLLSARVLTCHHVGRTELEVIDALLVKTTKTTQMCGCWKRRCCYGNTHRWMNNWTHRILARAGAPTDLILMDAVSMERAPEGLG